MAAEEHRTLREGVLAGFLGASAVALWFLILDTVAGRPFRLTVRPTMSSAP